MGSVAADLHLRLFRNGLREFDQSVIFTLSVAYRILLRSGETILCDNPANYPDEERSRARRSRISGLPLSLPRRILGTLCPCAEKRGIQTNMQYLDQKRVR